MGILKKAAISALAVMMLAGCYKVTYVSDKPMGETQTGSQSFFIFGLAGQANINVPQMCPNGAARLIVQQTFVDGLLGAITFGIYTPRSYELTCAKGG